VIRSDGSVLVQWRRKVAKIPLRTAPIEREKA
jgi:hypothetical protein